MTIQGYWCRIDSQRAGLIFRVVQEEGRSLWHDALQTGKWKLSSFATTLKREAASSSEAPEIIYQTKRRLIPQDMNLQYMWLGVSVAAFKFCQVPSTPAAYALPFKWPHTSPNTRNVFAWHQAAQCSDRHFSNLPWVTSYVYWCNVPQYMLGF